MTEPRTEPPKDEIDRLGEELTFVISVWTEYKELFAESPDRIDLLNACAGWFFGVTHRAFLREVILGISRLTDPLEQGNHRNLTLSVLLRDPGVNGRPEAKQKLERLVAEAIADAASIRVHRSKYIAHLDHAVAVDETEALLPPVAQADVERVLSRMADAYRAFWLDIRDIDYSLTLVVHSGGAKALVQVLEGSEWWAQVKAGNARSRAFQRRRDARSGTSVTK